MKANKFSFKSKVSLKIILFSTIVNNFKKYYGKNELYNQIIIYYIFQKIINHFELNKILCTKSGLINTMKNYYSKYFLESKVYFLKVKERLIESPTKIFMFTPTTFILTVGEEN